MKNPQCGHFHQHVGLFGRPHASKRSLLQVLVHIGKQSPDIIASVHVVKDDLEVGAGGQGIKFVYASSKTKVGMFL